jgi:Tfp pilus assembly protein PilX
MPNIRKGRRVQQCRDERGVALLAAIAVTIVVVLLSTAAIEQSVNSLTQSAIANQQVSSIDAAEAGVQAEFKQITSWRVGPSPVHPRRQVLQATRHWSAPVRSGRTTP